MNETIRHRVLANSATTLTLPEIISLQGKLLTQRPAEPAAAAQHERVMGLAYALRPIRSMELSLQSLSRR